MQQRYLQNMKHEINSRENQIADLFVRRHSKAFSESDLFLCALFVCANLGERIAQKLLNKSIENDQMHFSACFCLLHEIEVIDIFDRKNKSALKVICFFNFTLPTQKCRRNNKFNQFLVFFPVWRLQIVPIVGAKFSTF